MASSSEPSAGSDTGTGSGASGGVSGGGGPAPRGFYSPWFHSYKSLAFYSHLLSSVKRYARTVDDAGPDFRRLVWRELYQFAGFAASTDKMLNTAVADTKELFGPFVAGLLRLPMVNLVALELVYHSFHQAQRRYPDVFANMFTPIADGGYLEDAPADPDELELNGSGGEDSNMVSEDDGEEHDDAPEDTDVKEGDDMLDSVDRNEDDSGSNSVDQRKKAGRSRWRQTARKRSRQTHDTIWGSSIASALLQLNLLNAWVPTLERLSPFQKKALWDVCHLVPMFAAAYPISQNAQPPSEPTSKTTDEKEPTSMTFGSIPSFRKLFTRWAHDPLQSIPYITIMFASIAYLSYHKVIKHEFFYPGTHVPVFSRRASTEESAEQKTQTPPLKRAHMATEESETTDHSSEATKNPHADTGAENTGLTPEEFRRMLGRLGISIPPAPRKRTETAFDSATRLATTTLLLNRISSLATDGKGDLNTERATTIMDLYRSMSGNTLQQSPDAQEQTQTAESQPAVQDEDTITADEPAPDQLIEAVQELNTYETTTTTTTSPATSLTATTATTTTKPSLSVARTITELPSPTQPASTVIANSLDTVHEQLPPL